MAEHLPVIELFGPTIQGEGALCGQVSHFIRFGGCGFRCTWCDSMHAVDPAQVKKNARRMTYEAVVDEIIGLGAIKTTTWVTLTGGDPVMWDLQNLVYSLRIRGYRTAVETQGALWKSWLPYADFITVSPKGPSSGMLDKLDTEILDAYAALPEHRRAFKVVVFNKEDLEFAETLRERYKGAFYLTPGTPQDEGSSLESVRHHIMANYKWLVEQVLKRPSMHSAIIIPQMHSMLWGRELGR